MINYVLAWEDYSYPVPVIHQEIIRPEGKWYFRFIGETRWRVDPGGRPLAGRHGVRLYAKKGKFYVYRNHFLRTEHAYRY